MTQEMDNYIALTRACAEQCAQLLEAEQEKRQVLLDGDPAKLEPVLQAQQAQIMKLDQLEQKRAGAQRAAGFGDARADEVLAALDPGPAREELAALFGRLRSTAREVRELNRLSAEIAQMQLGVVERLLDGGTAGGGLYGPGGKERAGSAGGFERQV